MYCIFWIYSIYFKLFRGNSQKVYKQCYATMPEGCLHFKKNLLVCKLKIYPRFSRTTVLLPLKNWSIVQRHLHKSACAIFISLWCIIIFKFTYFRNISLAPDLLQIQSNFLLEIKISSKHTFSEQFLIFARTTQKTASWPAKKMYTAY